MSTCKRTAELARVEWATPEERKLLEAHVAECDSCRAGSAALSQARSVLVAHRVEPTEAQLAELQDGFAALSRASSVLAASRADPTPAQLVELRASVAARTERRSWMPVGVAAIAAAAAVAGLFFWPSAPPTRTLVEGRAAIAARTLSVGDELPRHERITMTPNSVARTEDATIAATQLAELELEPSRVLQASGTVRFDVARRTTSSFVVVTPLAEIHVVGTRFTVAVRPDETTVAVEEGIVEVRAPKADPWRLKAGDRVTIRPASKPPEHASLGAEALAAEAARAAAEARAAEIAQAVEAAGATGSGRAQANATARGEAAGSARAADSARTSRSARAGSTPTVGATRVAGSARAQATPRSAGSAQTADSARAAGSARAADEARAAGPTARAGSARAADEAEAHGIDGSSRGAGTSRAEALVNPADAERAEPDAEPPATEPMPPIEHVAPAELMRRADAARRARAYGEAAVLYAKVAASGGKLAEEASLRRAETLRLANDREGALAVLEAAGGARFAPERAALTAKVLVELDRPERAVAVLDAANATSYAVRAARLRTARLLLDDEPRLALRSAKPLLDAATPRSLRARALRIAIRAAHDLRDADAEEIYRAALEKLSEDE